MNMSYATGPKTLTAYWQFHEIVERPPAANPTFQVRLIGWSGRVNPMIDEWKRGLLPSYIQADVRKLRRLNVMLGYVGQGPNEVKELGCCITRVTVSPNIVMTDWIILFCMMASRNFFVVNLVELGWQSFCERATNGRDAMFLYHFFRMAAVMQGKVWSRTSSYRAWCEANRVINGEQPNFQGRVLLPRLVAK